MVCGPVQVVWHKFARYWDIEMREVPMAHGRYAMDPATMLERVDENTIMVVPTFGVTYTGAYEPVEAMASALDRLQAETGLDVDIHVDGASGAFLSPFCAPDVLFDFRLPRVKSISTSGHKFGLAPVGVGWVIWRDREELPEDLVFHVNYLGGDMPVFQINFSRPAGQVIAQYYNFLRLSHEGYRRIHDASYATGQYLAAESPQGSTTCSPHSRLADALLEAVLVVEDVALSPRSRTVDIRPVLNGHHINPTAVVVDPVDQARSASARQVSALLVPGGSAPAAT